MRLLWFCVAALLFLSLSEADSHLEGAEQAGTDVEVVDGAQVDSRTSEDYYSRRRYYKRRRIGSRYPSRRVYVGSRRRIPVIVTGVRRASPGIIGVASGIPGGTIVPVASSGFIPVGSPGVSTVGVPGVVAAGSPGVVQTVNTNSQGFRPVLVPGTDVRGFPVTGQGLQPRGSTVCPPLNCPSDCSTLPDVDGCVRCSCADQQAQCPAAPEECGESCELRLNRQGCRICLCQPEGGGPLRCPDVSNCDEDDCGTFIDESGCMRCRCGSGRFTCPAIRPCPESCDIELDDNGCPKCSCGDDDDRCENEDIVCPSGCRESEDDDGCKRCDCTGLARRGNGVCAPLPPCPTRCIDTRGVCPACNCANQVNSGNGNGAPGIAPHNRPSGFSTATFPQSVFGGLPFAPPSQGGQVFIPNQFNRAGFGASLFPVQGVIANGRNPGVASTFGVPGFGPAPNAGFPVISIKTRNKMPEKKDESKEMESREIIDDDHTDQDDAVQL